MKEKFQKNIFTILHVILAVAQQALCVSLVKMAAPV